MCVDVVKNGEISKMFLNKKHFHLNKMSTKEVLRWVVGCLELGGTDTLAKLVVATVCSGM